MARLVAFSVLPMLYYDRCTTYPAVLVGFTFLSGFGIVGRMSAGFLLLMET
jgi:hypothetical protein